MLGLCQQDAAGGHALFVQLLDLACHTLLPPTHGARKGQIEDAPIDDAAQLAHQQSKHLTCQRLQHNDRTSFWPSASAAAIAGTMTDDFPSPIFSRMTAFLPFVGSIISLAMSA